MKARILLSLACLSIATAVSGGSSCGPVFKGKCSCGLAAYDTKTQYVVNCTDTGFNSTTVLEHLPPETQVLIFTGNDLRELPWNVFGSFTNYSSLRVVDMSNNKIREIKGKSYHHVANVERLILNHNDLSIASSDGFSRSHHHPRVFSNFINLMELHLTNAFADGTPDALATDLHDIFVNSNLTRLLKLHLEQNEIMGFEDRQVFCDLPNLMDLHLGDNLLEAIDFNVLCLKNLRFLDLERNRMSSLSEKDLDLLDTFPARNQPLLVDLMGNPFVCDCRIRDLSRWLQGTKVNVRNRDALRCTKGPSEDAALEGLRPIPCVRVAAAPSTPAQQPRHAVTVVLALLLVLAVSALGALVFALRADIRTRFAPLLNTVSQKVQYTSIGRQEEPEINV